MSRLVAGVGVFSTSRSGRSGFHPPSGEASSVQVKISTRHGHLSDASQQNITARAEKLLRIFERITAIELTIDLKDSNSPRVDAQLSAEHKHDFVAHDQSDNLMGSIDTVLHRLEQQLRKYKEKVQERHRQPDTRRQSEATGPELE
jgi:putative sigma-54 modulation protein